jgi:hypothetical protein
MDEIANPYAEPAERLGVTFTREALDEIVRVTHGYPYFIQEWTYRVWNAAPRSPITKADVDNIRDLAIARLDESFFRVRFDRLTDLEKHYIRAMADVPDPIGSGDVATKLGRQLQRLTKTRDGLIKKGMIYSPKHGDVAFTVPLFDDFMRRTMPEPFVQQQNRTST